MDNSIEERVRNRVQRVQMQEAITLALFRLGTPSSAAFASEAYLRKRLGLTSLNQRSVSYRLGQAIKRLKKRGLVNYIKEGSSWRMELTPKGNIFADKIYAAERIRIRKPKRWDEKWRVVIFDVKEKHKTARDRLRRVLTKADFYRIQDSVWVHPYECEELVAFIRKELRITGSVLYLVAEGVEGDELLRQHFGL